MAAKPPADDFLCFLPADHFRDGLPDLASPEGRALLERVTSGVDLVILDNLSSLARGRENEADDWQPMQDTILSLRRRGVSSLLVHHAAKGGQQRGTSRREDILDTVIALRRPDGYSAAEGARFEVHFEKARGFMGAEAAPFEARLETTADGYRWHVSDLTSDDKTMALAMLADGETVPAVVKALGLSRSTVYRWQAEAAGG
jgi:putative DNA primase/helicase